MKKINFNKDWHYGDTSKCKDIFDGPPEYEQITLPHDAMILNRRERLCKSENTTGFFPGNTCEYIKIIRAGEYRDMGAGRRLIVEFEGVYMNAMVYVNGMLAGKCPYGYSSFFVDITDYLNENQDNELKVLAKTDMEQTSRWYPGTGIYRAVNLYTSGNVYIPPRGVKIRTPECSASGALVVVDTEIVNTSGRRMKAVLETRLIDSHGNGAGYGSYPVTLWPGETECLRQRIWVFGPQLWSTDSPAMYHAASRILFEETGSVMDTAETAFGIRRITVDAARGLLVNEESVKLRGACVHHDNGILGAVSCKDAEERKVRLLKSAGFNAVRSAHNPASEAFLDACDKYGMLVMDESFDMWNTFKSDHDYAQYFSEWWKHDIRAMVDKDFNHPCVFMYSIGNEIQEIGTPMGGKTTRMLAGYVRQLDHTRFVGNAINGMFTVMEDMDKILPQILGAEAKKLDLAGDINDLMFVLDTNMGNIMKHPIVGEAIEEACAGLDICGYNYMDSRYEIDGEKYPDRVIVGSETRPDAIARNWELVQRLPYLIGDFVWTGWDYIGEAGIGKIDYTMTKSKGIYGPYPWYLAYCGDFDLCGERRPQSYYREIVWGIRRKPYIAVENPMNYNKPSLKTNWSWSDTCASWTWPGCEGMPVHIEVYSCEPEVELFINGRSVGKKAVGEERPAMAVFDTVYEPGLVVAVAGDSYEESLHTARGQRFVALEADKSVLVPGSEDIAFVRIRIVDENNVPDLWTEAKISLRLEGPGRLLGYGSANPRGTEDFSGDIKTTFEGRLLAAIGAGDNEGQLVLTAYAPGMAPAQLVINGCKSGVKGYKNE